MKYHGDDGVQVGNGGSARRPMSWRVHRREVVFELEESVVEGIGGGLIRYLFDTRESSVIDNTLS